MLLIKLSCILLFLTSLLGFSQDERFYRKMFTGELFNPESPYKIPKISVKTPEYKIDINRDSLPETLQVFKDDGLDRLDILDHMGNKIFTHKFIPKGSNSKIYKIKYAALSKSVDLLLVYYFSGSTHSTKLEAQANLYFITLDNHSFESIQIFKGPHYWHEKEYLKEAYWKRPMSVNLIDYNNDKTREVSVTFNHIQRIYFYLTKGVWKKF